MYIVYFEIIIDPPKTDISCHKNKIVIMPRSFEEAFAHVVVQEEILVEPPPVLNDAIFPPIQKVDAAENQQQIARRPEIDVDTLRDGIVSANTNASYLSDILNFCNGSLLMRKIG